MMRETLSGGLDRGLSALYKSAAVEGYAEDLCTALDDSRYLIMRY